jgi:pimeloyl-ACP methyl ester carboxylesterase
VRAKGVSAMIDAMRNHPMVVQRLEGRVLPEGVSRHFDNMRRMSVDGYLGAAGAMQTWPGSSDRLPTICVPTLVMVGERDGLLPASHFIHRNIAGSRFVVISDCGHGTNLWRPESFNAETLDFLEAVDAGRDVAGEFVVR